jgi:hypothetical protein
LTPQPHDPTTPTPLSQDPALFAKVSFDSDAVVSQMNEYEVLQLLMGECRERLAAYKLSLEEEVKALQVGGGWAVCRPSSTARCAPLWDMERRSSPAPHCLHHHPSRLLSDPPPLPSSSPPLPTQAPDLQGIPRLAARQRMAEKTILTQFMDAVRRKLAPVRGIPTKAGAMADPNADLKEIFDTIEAIPSAPARLIDGFRRWARGEFDPEWKK